MLETSADVERAQAAFGFTPATTIDAGMPKVVAWCRDYFGSRL
jgi:UDP-glucuronate 4-epimerase